MTDNTTDVTAVATVVIQVIQVETGTANVDASQTLGELDIESLAFAEILMGIEDKLGTKLDLEESFDLDSSASVADLIAAVQNKYQS